jgi:outer membrane protein TolC
MKTSVILFMALLSTSARANPPETITLQDVTKRVSESNFAVYQNAIRVYQAKESIKAARGNLLPHLNLWDIAGAAADIYTGGGTGGAGVVGLISDIVPFLIPANWFRVQEVKLLYQADQLGYQALWANELMSAKALYMHVVLDQSLRENILHNIEEVSNIHKIVQMRELLGGAPQGSAREIEIRLLALQEDKRSMEVLLQEELSQLSFAMGMPAQTTLELTQIDLPNMATLEPLNYDDFEFRAVDSAPEINQYDYFIEASDYVRRETMYSFLGASSMSRGAGGGVFDNIPVTPGLGFGTAPSMRIVSAQKDILKLQKLGAEEVIKRQLKLLVNNYNLDL